jgi:uncharacterized protein with GYD domain
MCGKLAPEDADRPTKGITMARFVTFFAYTSEAWARLLDNPGDRSGPVGATIADAGGRLLSLDYLFGERDGMAIFEAPDSATAAAASEPCGADFGSDITPIERRDRSWHVDGHGSG